MKILTDLKALGYSITLEGDNIRLKYLGIGEHPSEAEPLIEALKAHKAEAVTYLRSKQPLPYVDGPNVVIPFESDGRYHWWNGGQRLEETEKSIRWKH